MIIVFVDLLLYSFVDFIQTGTGKTHTQVTSYEQIDVILHILNSRNVFKY